MCRFRVKRAGVAPTEGQPGIAVTFPPRERVHTRITEDKVAMTILRDRKIRILLAFFALVLAPSLSPAADVATTIQGHAEFSPQEIQWGTSQGYSTLKIPGYFNDGEVGYPELPERSYYYLLPEGYEAAELVIDHQEAIVDGNVHRLLPVRGSDWEEKGIQEAPQAYDTGRTAQLPERCVELAGSGPWRGKRIAEVVFRPVAWRPALEQVVYNTSVQFTIRLRPAATDAGVARSARLVPATEARTEQALARYVENAPPALPFQARSGTGVVSPSTFRPTDYPSLDGSRVDYVIITSDALAAEFQNLADWKTQTGMPAVVRTTSWIESHVPDGSDLQDKIRRFIRDAYQNWGTSFVLLGGDTEVIPPRYIHIHYYFLPQGEFIPTDLYYAALDGNWDNDGDGLYGEGYIPSEMAPGDSVDLFPEVYVGRAPVASVSETQTFIDKTKRYRTTPTSGQQTKAAFLAEVLFPYGWNPGDPIWTNGCDLAQNVAEFITDPGWDTVMVCEYPHGNMNYTSVKDALNAGYGLVTIITHGDPFKISSSDGKYVRIDDFATLSNNNKFSIYYYSNCSTSQYDSECLNEAAILNPAGGSVASIGPVRLEFPLTSDEYMAEFYRIFFQTGVEYLGEMSELHRVPSIAGAQIDNSTRWVHFSQLMLGDPALRPWHSLPGTMIFAHSGSMSVSDSAYAVTITELGTPIEGAQVVMWNKATGDYGQGVTDAAGMVTIPFRPTATGSVNLTATHDLYRTKATTVTVGAGSSARLEIAGVVVDDDGSGLSSGNGNGVAEAGERIELGVTLKNIGASTASGVSANLQLGTGAQLTLDVQQDGSGQTGRVYLGSGGEHPGALPFSLNLGGDTLSVWGRPLYTSASGPDSGAYFWQDLSGWHLRFVSGGAPQAFAGSLSTDGAVRVAAGYQLESGDVLTPGAGLVTFAVNVDSTDFEDGIDFVIDDSSHVSLLVPVAAYPDIGAGDSATAYFLVESEVSTPDLHQARMDVSVNGVTTGTVSWPEGLRFEVAAPVLIEDYHVLDDSTLGGNGDGDIDNGETVILTSRVRNTGHGMATGVQGILRALSGLTVIDSTDTFGDIAAGAVVSGSAGFQATATAASGWSAELELSDSDGRSWTETMELAVPLAPTGLITKAQSPQVPQAIDLRWSASTSTDTYGYNIYRSTTGGSGYVKVNGVSVERQAAYVDRAVAPESTYYYTVTAVDSAGNESRRSLVKGGTVRPPFQAGWPKTTKGTVWSSPIVMDLNEDSSGDFEVIVGSGDGYLYVWDSAGNDMPGWPRFLGSEIWASPAVGNLDPSDDEMEIVVGCNNNNLYAFNHDGSGLISPDGVFFTTSQQIRSTPTLADLDGDGDLEVIFGNSSGRVYALHHDGTPYMGSAIFAAPGGGAVVASPTVADLDGDGDLEVLFPMLGSGKVYAYNHDKTGYRDSTGVFSTVPASIWASLAVGDINDNGVMDVVCATYGGVIYVWNKQASLLFGWPRNTNGAQIWSSPALGDMNGDGDLEVVVGSSNDSLYVLQPDGSNLAGWPQSLPDSTWSSPCLADITGDGRPEVILASVDSYIYAYQYNGVPVPGWPIPTTDRTYGSGPTVGDLDGDGDVEVIVGTYDGRVYCWDVGKPWDPSASASPWPTFAHDSHRSGWFDQPFTDVTEGAMTLVPARFGLEQNVPNPFNPRTVIRYQLAKEGPVSLVIYDVTGRLVRRLVSDRQPAGVHEIAWTGEDDRGKDTASGVYFYRLEAGEKTFSRKMVLLR
jgi:hypothetical protein